jgi:hypothetical protein
MLRRGTAKYSVAAILVMSRDSAVKKVTHFRTYADKREKAKIIQVSLALRYGKGLEYI